MKAMQNRLDKLEGRHRADPYAHLSDDQLTDKIVRLARQIGEHDPDYVAESYSKVTGWSLAQSREWVSDVLAVRA